MKKWDRLIELRKKKGLSQEQMASIFGISRTGYSRWETKDYEPNIETLVGIADYFGVTLDYLLSHDQHTQVLSKDEKETLKVSIKILEKISK